MIGSLLALFESFFVEVSSSLGKKSIAKKEESPYAFLAITYAMSTLIYILFSLTAKAEYVFTMSSLHTFVPRVFTEILLAYIGVKSLSLFDRSFFSLARVMTIPFILCTDLLLGVAISRVHILAMCGMFLVFCLLCLEENIPWKKLHWALPLAILPAITLSLYKYDISTYNSVFGEEVTLFVILTLWAGFMDFFFTKENPFRLLSHPAILAQAFAGGIGSLASSFAYLYGSASLVTTLRRAYAVLTGILSDVFFFKRKIRVTTYVTVFLLLLLLVLLTLL